MRRADSQSVRKAELEKEMAVISNNHTLCTVYCLSSIMPY